MPRARAASQHPIYREKTSSPKISAAEILGCEEAERKRLAVMLHEDLAQTLAAVKISVENGIANTDAGGARRGSSESPVPALQTVIARLKALAAELRPSGLDYFGLLPTLETFCREFERLHPAIRIDDDFSVETDCALGPLAFVIYRVVESFFSNIALAEDTDRISISLRLQGQTVALTIDDTPRGISHCAAARRSAESDSTTRFALARERTILSGGTFSATRNISGGATLRANWAL